MNQLLASSCLVLVSAFTFGCVQAPARPSAGDAAPASTSDEKPVAAARAGDDSTRRTEGDSTMSVAPAAVGAPVTVVESKPALTTKSAVSTVGSEGLTVDPMKAAREPVGGADTGAHDEPDQASAQASRQAQASTGELVHAAAQEPAKPAPGLAVPAPAAASLTVRAELPREVRHAKPFEYRLVVTNAGVGEAADVVLVETLGDGLAYESSEPEGRVREDRAVEFQLGAILGGESRTLVIHAQVLGSDRAAVTRSSMVDVRLSESGGMRVTAPALALTETFSSADVLLCDDVNGRFVVSNTGTGRAEGVRIRSKLAAGVTTIDGKSELDVRVGDLESGASREFPFVLRAQATGAYTDQAQATAAGDLTATAEPAAFAVHQPALSLKVDGPDEPLTVGRTGAYAFVVQNTSDVVADDARVIATIPASLEFQLADGGGEHAGDRVTWSLGALPPGESRTMRVTCRGRSSAEMTVRASASARCAAEVRAVFGAVVRGAPDLRVRLTDVAGAVRVGEPQEYVCELSNLGQVDLTNVRVAAAWPTQLEWVDSPFRPEATVAGERAEFRLDTLAMGEKKRFTFRLRSKVAGPYKINSSTTCAEMNAPVSQDEVTTFVER